MGMFDNIIFADTPITCKCGYKQKCFQTKNPENCSDNYEVNKDGALLIEIFEMREDPERHPLFDIATYDKVSIGWEEIKHTGEIECHTSCPKCGDYWFEVYLLYSNGILLGKRFKTGELGSE